VSAAVQRRRVALVVNPASGPTSRNRVRYLHSILFRYVPSVEVEWFETTIGDPGTELTRRAVARGAEVVVACGGDGTVMACAAALAGLAIPLAVVPNGTGNIIATSLGIPSSLTSAASVALGPGRTQVDLCFDVEGRPFFAGSVGVTASIMRDSSAGLKRRFGMLAYAISTTRHLFDGSADYRVTFSDGTDLIRRADAVLVGNYAGLVRSTPLTSSALDDGVIEVGFLRLRPVLGWLLGTRAPPTRRPIEWHQTSGGVVVAASGDAPSERDGDWYGHCSNLSVTVVRRAVTLCVPPGPIISPSRPLASLAAKDITRLITGFIATRRPPAPRPASFDPPEGPGL
jgi:diacylglycerol kinase family enzyme